MDYDSNMPPERLWVFWKNLICEKICEESQHERA